MPSRRPAQLMVLLLLAVAGGLPRAADAAGDGARVFEHNCTLCHGARGLGDGRAARSMATPPANLTRSRLDADALRRIVTLGGAAVGRSSSMPPWGEALSATDIDAVVGHVCSLAGSCNGSTAGRAASSAVPHASH